MGNTWPGKTLKGIRVSHSMSHLKERLFPVHTKSFSHKIQPTFSFRATSRRPGIDFPTTMTYSEPLILYSESRRTFDFMLKFGGSRRSIKLIHIIRIE